jgi:hypothetical protein
MIHMLGAKDETSAAPPVSLEEQQVLLRFFESKVCE